MLLKNRGLFQVFHNHLMSRYAGAGRECSQTARPSWPMEIFHTIDIMFSLQMAVGQGARMLFSVSLNSLFSGNLLLSGNLNFSMSLVFCCEFDKLRETHKSGEIHKIRELQETLRIHDHCAGTGYTIRHWEGRKKLY